MEAGRCDNERVVASYDYATYKGMSGGKANLTITDKRIVSTIDGKNGIRKTEMPVSDVKSVEISYGRNVSPLAVTLLILGIYCIYMAIFFLTMGGARSERIRNVWTEYSMTLIFVGIVLLVASIILFSRKAVSIKFIARGKLGLPMKTGMQTAGMSKLIARKGDSVKTGGVRLNKAVFTQMMEEIGAAIINANLGATE